jgi:hypothetical protein
MTITPTRNRFVALALLVLVVTAIGLLFFGCAAPPTAPEAPSSGGVTTSGGARPTSPAFSQYGLGWPEDAQP